jgi:glycosyltransferase involved in cell wall biosynthesis
MPKVSVVIPTYNRTHFIAEAMQSVIDQTFTDFELIVVDDGSTDNTREVVSSFKDHRIKYIYYQENKGASSAQNTGIRASTGEYVAILGSDDIWLPQNLELQVKLLDSRPDIALVCSDMYLFDNNSRKLLGRFWHDKHSDAYINPQKVTQHALKRLLEKGCFIGPQATLMRRAVLTEVGCFDESLVTHEDWDLFVRIVKRFPICINDIPLTMVRKHGISLQSSTERMYNGAVRVLGKAMSSYSLTGQELRLIERRLARTHFRHGRHMVMNGSMTMGRKRLWNAIRTNPWCVRPYIYLALSLLGKRVILSTKSWKKRLSS